MNHQSLILAHVIIAGDAPPFYFLVIGIFLAIPAFKLLYEWSVAAKKAAVDIPLHLSPAQQRVRAKFTSDPKQIRTATIVFLLMAAFFIALYFVTSRV